VQVDRRFDMDGQGRRTGFGERRDVAFWFDDHQMHVERQGRGTTDS